jgi:WD40 repeat protein
MAAPSQIAHYRITAKLGEGGMGVVYRATDAKLGREVAVKVLPESFARDTGRMARFEREARVLASLNHPNIAAIYGVERHALILELVEGPTLAARIAEGPIPEQEALAVARQIGEALEYAHAKGVIHRDLKPANVKVTPDGTVKVLDFGLAKAVTEEVDRDPETSPTLTIRETQAGVIVGTAAYMAPEQAKGKSLDKRVDIWAFGVVLYEMLVGGSLFTGEAISDTLAAVLKTEPDWNRIPPRFRSLLRACLEKDPKQRLRDIADAWRLVEADESPAPSRPHSSLWPWAVAAVLAVALAASQLVPRPPANSAGAPLRLRVDLGAESLPDNRGLAISPDGRRLAIRFRGADGQVRLGIRRLDQDETVTTVAGTEGAFAPFFSPDGQWIGFGARGKLKKVATEGGAPVTISDALSVVGASWGDDGNIVATLGVGMTGMWRIPAAGGTPTPLLVLNPEKGELRHSWPQVLPGSQAVLFSSYSITGGLQAPNIEVLSLRNGHRKTLRAGFFARYVPSGHLIYIYENTLFAARLDLSRLELTGSPRPVMAVVTPWPNAFNALDRGGGLDFSRNGILVSLAGNPPPQRAIFWIDGKGSPQPLRASPGIYSYPRFSPDGKRLAFAVEDTQGHEEIWVQDLDRNTDSRVVSLPGANESLVWMPDGRGIVFISQNPTAPGIYWVQTDGTGEPQRLLELKYRLNPSTVSPDGKHVAGWGVLPGGRFSLWTAPFEGSPDHPRLGNVQMDVRPAGVLPRDPVFSPDGHWLAYCSDPNGTDEIYVRPFPGTGADVQVSTDGGTFPIWSRDGSLFFLSGSRIMVVDYRIQDGVFKPRRPQVWCTQPFIPTSPPLPMYDLAPDGKRFAAILYTDGTAMRKPITQVTFMLNFFDELKRLLP